MDSKSSHGGTQNGANATITVPSAPAAPKRQGLPEQRQDIQWMPQPLAIPGCPPGLEYLAQLDQILVHQVAEPCEVFASLRAETKYQITNALGQQVFYAFEESVSSMRQCCGHLRGFTMHVVNNMNQEVIRVVRPFQCCSGCWWCADCCECCALTITVESPPGLPIGHVRQRVSGWKAHYDILGPNFDPILKIRGPCCTFQTICCTADVDFTVLTADESQQVGNISKQWAGFSQECSTKADNFGITFPMDLDVRAKGTLLGALYLIDFMYFEKR